MSLFNMLGKLILACVILLTSCVAGTEIMAKRDKRIVANGDTVHPKFTVVALPGENGAPFQAVGLNGVTCDCDNLLSFVMSKSRDSISDSWSEIAYQVISSDDSGQLIEVVETLNNGDNTIWSRYKATKTGVTPISSRMFYFGYMFSGLPVAFVIMIVLLFAARITKKVLLEE